MTWQPGRRRAQRALESPFADVPEHLSQPLWDWIQGALVSNGYHYGRMQELAIALRVHLPAGSGSQQIAFFRQLCARPDEMLDLVELLLELYTYDGGRVFELAELLDRANSMYAVNDDYSGLIERVPAGVQQVVQEAVDAAQGSAGEHLAEAWNQAYGRRSDPVKAYSEAIKAVESALAPRITPQNARQTLGTMVRDVRDAPQNFKFAMNDTPSADGVQTVLAMMRQLWEGQTSRHGGPGPTRPETDEEARAAVHIAAALVQFGASAAFARRQG